MCAHACVCVNGMVYTTVVGKENFFFFNAMHAHSVPYAHVWCLPCRQLVAWRTLKISVTNGQTGVSHPRISPIRHSPVRSSRCVGLGVALAGRSKDAALVAMEHRVALAHAHHHQSTGDPQPQAAHAQVVREC